MPHLRDWKQAHEAAYEPAMKLRNEAARIFHAKLMAKIFGN